MAYKKQTKTIPLNLTRIADETLREQAKDEIGEFIVNEILLAVGEGKSPVEGETFPELNKEYAKREKKGDTTPNLQLEGDLMDALSFVNKAGSSEIEVGILDESQWGKADGHNKFGRKNNNKIPKRRFLPTKSGKFKSHIMDGVKQIIADYVAESQDLQQQNGFDIITTTQEVDFNIDEIINEKGFFDRLFEDK